MKFLITRASGDTNEKGSPYDGPYYGAAQEEYICTEVHSYVSSFESAKIAGITSWLEEGFAHREVMIDKRQHLVRDTLQSGWFIRLPSIADLYSFLEEVEHAVVIDRDTLNPGYLEIIVYDDYMD